MQPGGSGDISKASRNLPLMVLATEKDDKNCDLCKLLVDFVGPLKRQMIKKKLQRVKDEEAEAEA